MSVNPAIRLIFMVVIILVLFFMGVTYTNILASKNVELGDLDRNLNSELSAQGTNQEEVNRVLNDELRTMQKSENISRVSPDQTIKIRDIKDKSTQTTPNQDSTSKPRDSATIIAY